MTHSSSKTAAARQRKRMWKTAPPSDEGFDMVYQTYTGAGTDASVRRLLSAEANVIFECSCCREMFRSAPSFIAHKQTTCRGLMRSADVQQQQSPNEEQPTNKDIDHSSSNSGEVGKNEVPTVTAAPHPTTIDKQEMIVERPIVERPSSRASDELEEFRGLEENTRHQSFKEIDQTIAVEDAVVKEDFAIEDEEGSAEEEPRHKYKEFDVSPANVVASRRQRQKNRLFFGDEFVVVGRQRRRRSNGSHRLTSALSMPSSKPSASSEQNSIVSSSPAPPALSVVDEKQQNAAKDDEIDRMMRSGSSRGSRGGKHGGARKRRLSASKKKSPLAIDESPMKVPVRTTTTSPVAPPPVTPFRHGTTSVRFRRNLLQKGLMSAAFDDGDDDVDGENNTDKGKQTQLSSESTSSEENTQLLSQATAATASSETISSTIASNDHRSNHDESDHSCSLETFRHRRHDHDHVVQLRQEINQHKDHGDEPIATSVFAKQDDIVSVFEASESSLAEDSGFFGPSSTSSSMDECAAYERPSSLHPPASSKADASSNKNDSFDGRLTTIDEDLARIPIVLTEQQRDFIMNTMVPVAPKDSDETTHIDGKEAVVFRQCIACNATMKSTKDSLRHAVSHIRAIRLYCSMCGVGAFFCADMRRHLMFRHCDGLTQHHLPEGSAAVKNTVSATVPCMTRQQADRLTKLVDPEHPGQVVLSTSGRIICCASPKPYYPDAEIEIRILGSKAASVFSFFPAIQKSQ